MQKIPVIGDSRATEIGRGWLELKIAGGPLDGLSGTVTSMESLLVGRARNCHLQVFDRRVSREHFLTECSQGRWRIRDLSSRNGTFVNDQRVDYFIEVHDGDLLAAGDTVFEIAILEDVVDRLDTDHVTAMERDLADREITSTLRDGLV